MSAENNDRQELLEEAKQLGLEFHSNIKTDKLAELVEANKVDQLNEGSISTPVVEDDTSKTEPTTVSVPVDVLKQMQEEIKQLQEAKVIDPTAKVAQPSGISDLVSALQGVTGNGVAKIKGIDISDSPNRVTAYKRANTLIRCRVSPRDPLLMNRKTFTLTVSNDLVGDMKYNVPFNIDTHIPYFIYKTLLTKTCEVHDETVEKGDLKIGRQKGGSMTVPAYGITVLTPLTEDELKALAKKQKLRSKDLDEREDAILETDGEETEVVDPLKDAGYNL